MEQNPAGEGQEEAESRQDDDAAIPAIAVKTQDEAEEIDAERQDPEKGDGGDVLAEVVGDREREDRREDGKI